MDVLLGVQSVDTVGRLYNIILSIGRANVFCDAFVIPKPILCGHIHGILM
jgi:hypothetical protein